MLRYDDARSQNSNSSSDPLASTIPQSLRSGFATGRRRSPLRHTLRHKVVDIGDPGRFALRRHRHQRLSPRRFRFGYANARCRHRHQIAGFHAAASALHGENHFALALSSHSTPFCSSLSTVGRVTRPLPHPPMIRCTVSPAAALSPSPQHGNRKKKRRHSINATAIRARRRRAITRYRRHRSGSTSAFLGFLQLPVHPPRFITLLILIYVSRRRLARTFTHGARRPAVGHRRHRRHRTAATGRAAPRRAAHRAQLRRSPPGHRHGAPPQSGQHRHRAPAGRRVVTGAGISVTGTGRPGVRHRFHPGRTGLGSPRGETPAAFVAIRRCTATAI